MIVATNYGLDGFFNIVVARSQDEVLLQSPTNGSNGSFGVDGLAPVYRKLYAKSVCFFVFK